VRADKRGAIDAARLPILARLGLPGRVWQCQVLGIESRYWRAIGRAEAMMERAAALGQRWLEGIGHARRLSDSAL
jgi:hypothetical protein